MARILLVEDARHDSAAALHGLLHAAGHEVERIGDGAAALERILQAPPALTLLEVALPRIDGLRVLASGCAENAVRKWLVGVRGFEPPAPTSRT